MPSRRTHQKSRLGCVHCKRRRVKCDEQRPRCSSCTIRGVQCEYATSGSLIWPRQIRPSPVAGRQGAQGLEHTLNALEIFNQFVTTGSSSGSSSSSNNGTAALPPAVPNVRELELMVQWCTSTALTLARDEPTRHIWQAIVPKLAVSHLFLMHGVLAISALHLARSDGHRDQTDPYLPVSLAHHNQAIALVRPLLEDINGSNSNAIFASAAIIIVFVFGYPQSSNPDDTLAPVDEICRVFSVARGIQGVLNVARDWVTGGELGHLLQLDDHTPCLPADARVALDQLRSRNAASGRQNAQHETEVYVHTIDQIQLMLERLHGGCSRASLAVLWAVKVPERYLELLRAHEPMALAMLAHYCVILHGLAEVWYLQGWRWRILHAIWRHFAPEPGWRASIQWAMEVTGTITST